MSTVVLVRGLWWSILLFKHCIHSASDDGRNVLDTQHVPYKMSDYDSHWDSMDNVDLGSYLSIQHHTTTPNESREDESSWTMMPASGLDDATSHSPSSSSSSSDRVVSVFYQGDPDCSLVENSKNATGRDHVLSITAPSGMMNNSAIVTKYDVQNDSTEADEFLLAGLLNNNGNPSTTNSKWKEDKKRNKKGKKGNKGSSQSKSIKQKSKKESYPGKYPFVALVKYKGVFHCVGSIISPKYILSSRQWAAVDPNVTNFMVSVGVHNLVKEELPAEQTIPVQEIHLHPNLGNMVHSYDFALYELRNHIKEKGRLIQMIALPLPNTQLLSGGECFVVGWGKAVKDSERTRDIKYAEVMAVELSDAKLSLISFSACEEAYGRKVDHSMICAGYRGERGENYSPKGDRGGPLVCKVDGGAGWIQAGVVSWGIARASLGRFGVFARVTAARPWIKQISQV